jgi:Flp pilus assembly protein TadG
MGSDQPHRRDLGSVAVELTLLVPLFVVLLLAIVHGGRILHARTQVRAAAHSAARAASLARTRSAASSAAQTAALQNRTSGTSCRSMRVDVDLADFHPGGAVAVTVHCRTNLSDLGLLGVPGSRTISARSVEVVDRWRAG